MKYVTVGGVVDFGEGSCPGRGERGAAYVL